MLLKKIKKTFFLNKILLYITMFVSNKKTSYNSKSIFYFIFDGYLFKFIKF